MRDFVVLGSSSIVTPPNNHHHDGHRHRSPNPKPITSSTSTSPLRLPAAFRYRLTSRPKKSAFKYQAVVAAKLAGDGRLSEFTMILESVASSGMDPFDFAAALSLKPVGEGILLNLRDGNVEIVLEVFRQVKKLGISPVELFDQVTLESFRRECGRIVERKQLWEVVQFLENLAEFGFSVIDIMDPMEIVKMCVDQRDPDLAVRYGTICQPDRMLLCTIIREFGERKDLASALTAYEAFTELSTITNMYMCRTIIDVCGLCGDYMKSRFIFEDMLKQKIVPNTYLFNSLMNVNAHDLAYIMRIYQKMQEVGVRADTTSYNIILKACRLAGRADTAWNIYNKIRLMESTSGPKLDVFTYSTIIKVLTDAKLWEMALKVKDDMRLAGVRPNVYTWSALISASAKAGRVKHAIQLFEEMVESGCEPNTRCCNILLHACVKARQYDRAFRLFRLWKQNRTLGETYSEETNNIPESVDAERLCSSTAPEIVSDSHHLNFIKKFPFQPTLSTYNVMMKACGTDYDRARALMCEMKQEGLSPDKICWSILIDLCGASKDAERAVQVNKVPSSISTQKYALNVQTLKDMRMDGVEPDDIAYTTTIKVCVESGNSQLAFSVFAEMKRYRVKPDLTTYNTLLRARTQYGSLKEVQQCLAIYQEMRKAGYDANDHYLEQLIEEWCEGAIQRSRSGSRRGRISGQTRTSLEGSKNLFLEKVAAHLQKGISGNVTINLQGLTKVCSTSIAKADDGLANVESRIVVLAVLRMTKEKYNLGEPVTDDILILFGMEEASKSATSGSEQIDAILKLLRKDLGLEMSTSLPDSNVNVKPVVSSTKNMELSYTRRPVRQPRITITKEALLRWVEKNSR
ncbi:Pentatricopeptide repeat-containing protein At5g02830, chloroplastic [Linum grandiflorum]